MKLHSLSIKRKAKSLLGIAAAFAITACANVPPESLPAHFDFGERPADYEQKINAHFESILKDYDSARFKYGERFEKMQCLTLELRGTPRKIKYAGWARKVMVNAKNSYGGYGGYKLYVVPFKDGQVWAVYDERDFHFNGCEFLTR